MNWNRKSIILLIITLIWMAIIFRMSAAPASESSETSETVGKIVCSVFVPGYSKMSETKQDNLAKAIDHPVRKTAHVLEYMILGILMALLFSYSCKSGGGNGSISVKRYIISFAVCVLYAASDEFHQLFVPGRSGQVKDVCIDSCGILLGTLLIYLLLFRPNKL